MTAKRFTLEMQYWKGNPQGRKLFDNVTGQDGMSVEELCNIASDLHSKCEELKSVLEVYEDSLDKLEDENKELKKENAQFDILIKNNQLVYIDLEKENEQLKKDLIDYSALISMLEDYQALKIEETLWNLTGAKSEEEFNELYKPYLDKAKRSF